VDDIRSTMNNEQTNRVNEMAELRQKLKISIEVAETVEQQAFRIARQHTTLPSLEVRNNLERALNPFG
jgi:hypothetical protein